MSKPVYDIKPIDKVTHSRSITLEDLIELFKDHCEAPEEARVLFNYSLGDLKKKVEIIWTEDAPKRTIGIPTEVVLGCVPGVQIQKASETPCPPPTVEHPVATFNVEAGDLVMVQDDPDGGWAGPKLLDAVRGGHLKYLCDGVGWKFARHLTDEERAQIKRI